MSTTHNEIVRDSFTSQATAFAANPWVSDEQRIARLVSAARLTGTERVLDIATGPGYIAEAFAKDSREVLGMDLTEAMLDIARARTKERGVKNISFRVGDAQNLPFDEGEFDVVVCRLALHHVQQPAKVVSGMARVCRAGGMWLVENITRSFACAGVAVKRAAAHFSRRGIGDRNGKHRGRSLPGSRTMDGDNESAGGACRGNTAFAGR